MLVGSRLDRKLSDWKDTKSGAVHSDREALLFSNSQKGSNQTAIKNYNERLILQLVRNNGRLTKTEAIRATGLSANTVSVIFKTLEAENLLTRGEPERGKIGQPSVPAAIDPSARHYLGLKIGRRSFDLAIIDFSGSVLADAQEFHKYPTPERCLAFVNRAIPTLLRRAAIGKKDVSGFGVAMPWELWSWTSEFGAPLENMEAWKHFDIKAAIDKLGPWSVEVKNDATAACAAELMHGQHLDKTDFVYFFVGTFIGGGIVLNSSMFYGRRGNAGGYGPLRVPGGAPGKNRLVDHASLSVLEDMVQQAGGDASRVSSDSQFWADFPDLVQDWIEIAARGLAHAAVSSLAVIDFDAIVIDGAFPDHVRKALVVAVEIQLDELDLQGVRRPSIEPGQFGRIARVVGAATLPMYTAYAVNQNNLMRSV